MNYYEAAKIRKKGFADLMADKLTSGQGVFSSARSALSDRSKARSLGFKEKFDPLNIAKVLTGGSNLAPAMLGKLLGRKSSDIKYFTGKKEYTPRRESSYYNNYTTPSMSGGSQKATRTLNKMLSFMEKSRTDDMQERDTLDSFNELNEYMREDRHKEVVDVFIQATKAKRKAEKDMAKEAKKREREAKKVEKETSKDTGGKGAADAAAAAKKAKDAADAAKKAKDAADAAKKAKDAADAADAAKKAKDAADAAKKAKDAADAADAAKKAKDAADAADAAKKAKDAADAAKKAKDAAEAKHIKDAADAKRAADTAKKQESVPKNKSAEKVKETKSEVPSATPATPAIEAAKTAVKVGVAGVAGISASAALSIERETGKPAKDAIKNVGQIVLNDPKSGVSSYGIFGINSGGSVQSFVKDNPQFELNAKPASKQFDEQWSKISKEQPQQMLDAQLRWYEKNITKPLKNDLTKIVATEFANDPRVLTYMSDRRVQYGKTMESQALKHASSAKSVEEFLSLMSQYDLANLKDAFKTYLSNHPNAIKGLEKRIREREKFSLKVIENDSNLGEKLSFGSMQNADMKKDMSQGSSSGGTVIIQNNNTTQAKSVTHRSAPQEQLNPTMR